MRQRWERLTFLHWPFEPAEVQRLLPDGLAADLFGGAAWLGLVPFFMHVATPDPRRRRLRLCPWNVEIKPRYEHLALPGRQPAQRGQYPAVLLADKNHRFRRWRC